MAAGSAGSALWGVREQKCFLHILLLNRPPPPLRTPAQERLDIVEALGEEEEQPLVQGRRRH